MFWFIWHKRTRRKHQFISVTQLCLTLCDPKDCNIPGFLVHHNAWRFLKLMSIESVMPSNHLILWSPLLLLPPIPPSIRIFSKLGKEYINSICFNSAYLNSMKSTSFEMQSWINHKVESRKLGEISTASDMQMIPL